MIPAIIAVTILLIVLLIAVKIGINKSKLTPSVLHSSGIYSITRKSPRENIAGFKPTREDILKYFSNKNVNSINSAMPGNLLPALLKRMG